MVGVEDATRWGRRIRLVIPALAAILVGCSTGDPGIPADGGTTDTGAQPEAAPGHDGGSKPDAGVDATMVHDAGHDSGHDAGVDSGRDSGTDSGHDAGADSGHDADMDVSASTFIIGGAVSGLPTGDIVVLLDNGGDMLPVATNGPFVFATPESMYNVTVATQPPDANCVVTAGVATATATVNSVVVTCTPMTFTVGGTLSGLPATESIVLGNGTATGIVDFTVSANGPFTFPGMFSDGYAVGIVTQPSSALCTVTGGSGPLTANVSNVVVACTPAYTIGGALTGLPAGTSITLVDNADDNLVLMANATFTFPTATIPYDVTIATQPVGATCTVTGGMGMATANVSNIAVACFGSGTLDLTFGGGQGWVRYKPTTYHNLWYRLVMNPDDTFVLAGLNQTGASEEDWYISELNTTGAFDTGFAMGGSIDIPLGNAIGQRAQTIALATNGDYYVGGQFYTATNGFDFSVVRLTPSGTVDTTYANAGTAGYALAGNQSAYGMYLYADGSVLLAGINGTSGNTGTTMLFVRFTSAGVLDTTFGTGGVVTYGIATNDTEANDVVVDTAGNITAVGYVNSGTSTAVIVRLTPTGAFATGFGTNGVMTLDLSGMGLANTLNRVRLDSAGRVVTGGTASSGALTDFVVARLTTANVLDTTFGTGGLAQVNDTHSDNLTALTLQTNGQILYGGNGGTNNQLAFVGRLNTNGAIDTTFATNGFFTNSFGGSFACNVYDIGIDSQQRIILGGSWAPSNPSLGAARLYP